MAALRSVVVAALLSDVASMLYPRSGCAQRGPLIFERWTRSKDALERSSIGTAATAKFAKVQVGPSHISTAALASNSYSAGGHSSDSAVGHWPDGASGVTWGFWSQSVAASRSTTIRMMPRDDRPLLREVSGGFWPGTKKGAPIGGTWWVTARNAKIKGNQLTAELRDELNAEWVKRTVTFKNGDIFANDNGNFYKEDNLVLRSGLGPNDGPKTDDKDASLSTSALDELKKLRGLSGAKDIAQELYTRTMVEKHLPMKMRVVTSLNFALLGNPGTGKTTVARLLGRQLQELGLRETDVFVETTGGELVREGAKFVIALIEEAKDGVLFIDEAEALEPAGNSEGKAVLRLLAEAAENQRASLTIIIAGTKSGIEDNLYGFNPAVKSLFRDIVLDDFTQPELKEIWLEMSAASNWLLKPGVADVASRRVARGRGVTGFANARTVRTLFERSYTRALGRIDASTKKWPARKGALVIEVVDVIGPPPRTEDVPDLKEALAELDALTGLDEIKLQVTKFMQLAAINYERELASEPPHLIPLNRLFLGNPGTGKTTVATIYGRILKGLGYLSDGSVVVKTPSDLIAGVVGGTEEKTAALLEVCKGKVLVIDEAYALHEGMYGARAIDTIVSKVQNSEGDDIAVLLLGYEPEMLKMLRESNPGLQRRFSPESAFRFADFTDDQLEALLRSNAATVGLSWAKPSVCKEAVQLLVRERIKPNFGNAGAVNELMGRVKASIAQRGDAREIEMSDLGLNENAAGGSAETETLLKEVEQEMAGLFKGEHLQLHFKELAARLSQQQKDGQFDPSRPADKVGSYIFVGSPGTGKTTFARLLAKYLRAKGMLAGDGFAEQSALNLQGEYLGQTKKKVDDLIASAPGGMVFIDEAYNLAGRGSSLFAQEAVDQLAYCMTADAYRGKSIIVLAGYEAEMNAMLAVANPGFRSRFKQRVSFPDWDSADVVLYLQRRCEKEGFYLPDAARDVLWSALKQMSTRPGWANARDAEWVWDELLGARAIRLADAEEDAARDAAARATEMEQDVRSQFDKIVRRRVVPRSSPPPAPPPRRLLTVEDAHAAMGNFDALRPLPPIEWQQNAATVLGKLRTSGDDEPTGAEPPTPPEEARLREMSPPIVQTEHEVEYETEREAEIEIDEPARDDSSGESVASALQATCVELGYDENNVKRKELVAKLSGCEASRDFPPDIMGLVCAKTRRTPAEVLDELREQVTGVTQAMREAIYQAEQEQYRKDTVIREKVMAMGLCPAGFDWHREGCGWRCNGGSHFVSNDQLPEELD